MSRLRPHTVKASLSDEEKKAIASIAKRHKLSEAELIRFVLCNINEFDIDFGSAENVDQKSRSEEIHIKVSPAEKKKIESTAENKKKNSESAIKAISADFKTEKAKTEAPAQKKTKAVGISHFDTAVNSENEFTEDANDKY